MDANTQDYVTICIPLRNHGEWTNAKVRELESMIEAIGNPIKEPIKGRLDAAGIVHFFSMNMLPWDEDDQTAFLIIEAVVDGDARSAIAIIADSIGDFLYPIVAKASGLKHRDELISCLKRNHSDIKQNLLQIQRGRIPGLVFNGKAGLSVKTIWRNQNTSDVIREAAATLPKEADSDGPITRFKRLKQIAEDQDGGGAQPGFKFNAEKADELSFADKKDAPWLAHAHSVELGVFQQARLVFLGEVKLALALLFIFLFFVFGHFFGFGLVHAVVENISALFGGSAVRQSYFASDTYWSTLGLDLLCAQDCSNVVDGEAPINQIKDLSFSQKVWLIFTQFLALIASFLLAIATCFFAILGGAWMARKRLNWSESGDYADAGKLRPDGKPKPLDMRRNYPRDLDPDPKLVAEIMRFENHPGYLQNHMYHAVPMIKGWFRLATLQFGFRAVKHALTKLGAVRPGFLGEVGTAQSVRWFIPPGSNRLVFCGNYDGNWESYLEAFVTKASSGTNAIWSNAQGFPRTQDLFRKGAEDGDRLKRYARRTMMPSRCWYSAYPTLTAEQIRKQALIHNGLCLIDESDGSQAQAWLNLFDSVPRPENVIEDDKVQSLVFGNQSKLKFARLLALNFGSIDQEKKETLQAWLYRDLVSSRVTFGNKAPENEAWYVAFSADGLRKLGLEELFEARKDPLAGDDQFKVEPSEFAPAFGMGMGHDARRRLLNDPDSSEWQWGGPDSAADMVVMVYYLNEEELITELESFKLSFRRLADRLGNDKAKIVKELDISLKEKMERKEPFGFDDGISQPIVRGFRRNQDEDSLHLVEPGEFLLGYKDNRGFYPPTPHIIVENEEELADSGLLNEQDTSVYLPAPPDDMPGRYPAFSGRGKLRDFGRNGSYLVIRQIEQYVAQFDAYCEKAADTAKRNGMADYSVDDIGALFVGRHKDGQTLMDRPAGSGDSKPALLDNEFLFGDTDPQGRKCPFGAHIRRSNPRDSLNPVSDSELEVSNRHRLLRRGRAYWNGDGENDTAQGLLFVALNSDIERQFEFVQSTWLNSPSFHGLEGESDPLLQSGDGKFSLPTDKGTHRFDGLSQFTKLQGGGYFFLPGRQALYYISVSLRVFQEPDGSGMDYPAYLDMPPIPEPSPPLPPLSTPE